MDAYQAVTSELEANTAVPEYGDGDSSFSYACRICLDEGPRHDFIAPCHCKGTSKWVHRACLDRWRSMREDIAFSQCTECHGKYVLQVVGDSNEESRCRRKYRFCLLAGRDLLLMILFLILLVIISSATVYLLDRMLGYMLLNWSHMKDKALLLYVTSGIALLFGILGSHFLLVYSGLCCENDVQNVTYSNRACCPNELVAHSCASAELHPGCCCFECEQCCNGSVIGDSCHWGACCECSGASCGDELLAVALVVGIALILVGFVVSIFFGVLLLQSVARRHWHILGKLTLAKEYVVKDLAEDAQSLGTPEDNQRMTRQGHQEKKSNTRTFLFYPFQNILAASPNRQLLPNTVDEIELEQMGLISEHNA